MNDRVEATNSSAEAHRRVQVATADVGSNVDPHGQGKAVHKGSVFFGSGASENLEEHHTHELHGEGNGELA